jgi:hypothetical protein
MADEEYTILFKYGDHPHTTGGGSRAVQTAAAAYALRSVGLGFNVYKMTDKLRSETTQHLKDLTSGNMTYFPKGNKIAGDIKLPNVSSITPTPIPKSIPNISKSNMGSPRTSFPPSPSQNRPAPPSTYNPKLSKEENEELRKYTMGIENTPKSMGDIYKRGNGPSEVELMGRTGEHPLEIKARFDKPSAPNEVVSKGLATSQKSPELTPGFSMDINPIAAQKMREQNLIAEKIAQTKKKVRSKENQEEIDYYSGKISDKNPKAGVHFQPERLIGLLDGILETGENAIKKLKDSF